MKYIITERQYKLIKEQTEYGFWDKVVDFFLPGTPVKDGRELLKKFDDIIKRRLDYNKRNNLPPETLTQEEKDFREKIFKATPNLNYPTLFGISKIIQDINKGKNIRPEEFKNYTDPSFWSTKVKQPEKEVNKLLDSRGELKRMWLGIDEPGGETKGYWIKSEFKPKYSSNDNNVYYRPKNIPKLTNQQFDELYNAILKTKLTDGKYPGGNSKQIIDNILDNKYKFVTLDLIKMLSGDEPSAYESMLGTFKLGADEENGKKYISIYDEWDLMPPSAEKFGVNVQKYGKTPLIYYRIYR